MKLSEFEYHLISKLIGTEDRPLAARIELAIFPYSNLADPKVVDIMTTFVSVMDDDGEFETKAQEWLDKNGYDYLGHNSLNEPCETCRMLPGRFDLQDGRKVCSDCKEVVGSGSPSEPLG